jgi:putative transposase
VSTSLFSHRPRLLRITSFSVGGFDFGCKTFLTDDEGRQYHLPQFYRANLTEIARIYRALSRKQQGSHNREKARRSLAKAYRLLVNRRRDFWFKLANRLLAEYDVLCFEVLNIEGRKRIWGRKVSDLGFSEFISILEVKASILGKTIIKINRFDQSSQICSECGYRQSMPLSERVLLSKLRCDHGSRPQRS